MALAELQLGRVLDGDEALAVVDEGRQHVEQGRLARAGAPADQDVEPGPDGIGEEIEHFGAHCAALRSEEHTSELQSLMRISYAVVCLKKKNKTIKSHQIPTY